MLIAVGPFCWGKGETEVEAVKKMKKEGGHHGNRKVKYQLYEVHPDTRVDSGGNFVYPEGAERPKLLKEVG